MKGIIIYKGKYGATRQYADWAGRELRLPLFEPVNAGREKLAQCDFVVIASSVYMGKLLIANWMKQHINLLQTKKIFLLVVCATPSSEKEKQAKIIKDNVPDLLLDQCDIFFLPGRLIIKKLSMMDRIFLKIGSMLEKDPVKKKAMQQDIDAVKPEHIHRLLNAVGAFSSGETILRETGVPV